MNLSVCSLPKTVFKPSYRGRKYGSTFSFRSPGKKPKDSPASTAGLVNTIRLTEPLRNCLAAYTTAKMFYQYQQDLFQILSHFSS